MVTGPHGVSLSLFLLSLFFQKGGRGKGATTTGERERGGGRVSHSTTPTLFHWSGHVRVGEKVRERKCERERTNGMGDE